MEFVFISIVLFIGFFFILSKIRKSQLVERDRLFLSTVTQPNRGTFTENDLILRLLKYGIPAETMFHDLYLQKYRGNFSQIDLVVITNVGIIVFEVKDFSGWIFGKGNQSQWTKVLAYGREKYRFYNPIMQNNKHIEDLRNQLKPFGSIPFYSVVVFYGDCVLKDVSFVPNGTYLVKSYRVLEVMDIILSNKKLAQYNNINEIVRILNEAVKNGENTQNQIQHIRNINDMLGKDRIME